MFNLLISAVKRVWRIPLKTFSIQRYSISLHRWCSQRKSGIFFAEYGCKWQKPFEWIKRLFTKGFSLD